MKVMTYRAQAKGPARLAAVSRRHTRLRTRGETQATNDLLGFDFGELMRESTKPARKQNGAPGAPASSSEPATDSPSSASPNAPQLSQSSPEDGGSSTAPPPASAPAPDASQLQLPSTDAPAPVPPTDAPNQPAFELPKFELPKFELPNISPPKAFEAPSFSKPDVEVPSYGSEPRSSPMPSPPSELAAPPSSRTAFEESTRGGAPQPAESLPPSAASKPAESGTAGAPQQAPERPAPAPSAAGNAPDAAPSPPDTAAPSPADAQQAASSAGHAASDAADRASDATADAISGAEGATAQAQDQVTESVRGFTDSASAALDSARDSADAALQGFRQEVDASTERVQGALTFRPSAPDLPPLPPEVQSQVTQASNIFAQLKGRYDEAPVAYTAILLAALSALGVSYYKSRFEGLRGVLSPQQVSDLLEDEANVLLIDIRSEAELEKDGLLNLTRSARGKGVSLPQSALPAAVRQGVSNTGQLRRRINAALICGLEPVNSVTKIIIMDSRGGEAKGIAREVNALGCQGYEAAGGFAAWRKAGLAVKSSGSYRVMPGEVLTDKSVELQEAAARTFGDLSKPANKLLAGGGAAGVVSALAFPHTTFQYIGIVGIELTILRALLSYDSPSALVRDWSYRAGQAAKVASNLSASASQRVQSARADASSSASVGASSSASAGASSSATGGAVEKQSGNMEGAAAVKE